MTAPTSQPGVRALRARLRLAWESVRPFPRPRYRPGTPAVATGDDLDLVRPPSAETLAAAATSPEAARAVAEVLGRLTPGGGSRLNQHFYQRSLERYGEHWRHADLLTALHAATTLLRPEAYLEVGVHRGRSAAVVGATQPDCAIYGFDLWIADYAGLDSPGPDFVRGELAKVGHRGALELVSGESGRTLPAFLAAHPDLCFDMITIDGDKSVAGAASDFAHALPRLKVGGVVISDDLPVVPVLRRVWRAVVERDRRYRSWEFSDGTGGVAIAVRVRE